MNRYSLVYIERTTNKVPIAMIYDSRHKHGDVPLVTFYGGQALEAAKERYKQLSGEDYIY